MIESQVDGSDYGICPRFLIVQVVVRRGQAVVIDCPFCGDVHHHGHSEGDPTVPGASLGSRLSHCVVCPMADYELIIAPTGTVEPKQRKVRYDRNGRAFLSSRRSAPLVGEGGHGMKSQP